MIDIPNSTDASGDDTLYLGATVTTLFLYLIQQHPFQMEQPDVSSHRFFLGSMRLDFNTLELIGLEAIYSQ